jgi:regulator of RNase E activity RraA
MSSPLTEETRSLLARASTATLQTQLFKRGLRNTFLFGVRPLSLSSASFVGEAATCRFVPAREDIDVIELLGDPTYPQRVIIDTLDAGKVLVMDGRQDPRAAVAGEILITRLVVRGAAALVTDASVRDSHRIAEMGLPVYVAGVSASNNLTLHHAVDVNVPVACAGVAVYPGDVLVGDAEGVVAIPAHLADEVAGAAAEQEAQEVFLQARVAAGAPLRGTYPPNPEVLAEWEAHRAAAAASGAAAGNGEGAV